MLVYLIILAALAHSEVLAVDEIVEVGKDRPIPNRYELHGIYEIASGQCNGEVMREMMPNCNEGGKLGPAAIYSKAVATPPPGEGITAMLYLNDSPNGPIFIWRDPATGCNGAVTVKVKTVCGPRYFPDDP